MERLTKRAENGHAYLVNVKPNEQEVDCKSKNTAQCIMDSFERLAAYEDAGLTPEEVAALAEAKAEGRLVELPKTGTGDMSDGYHTFNELYHHRAVLFSVIVSNHSDKCWKSKKHDDGTMFDGMFIVGIETPTGNATYHYDIEPYWNMFRCKEIDNAPAWDGHTPDDAIRRIASLTHEVALEAQEGE